jgi:hypothetical protein
MVVAFLSARSAFTFLWRRWKRRTNLSLSRLKCVSIPTAVPVVVALVVVAAAAAASVV